MEVGRANNGIRIPTSLKGNFFRIWIEYLTPLHGLTNREKDVAAAFLKKRFELKSSIPDEVWLDKAVMSEEIKSKIKEECKVSDAFFQVILGKLRKAGVILGDKINPKFVPKRLNAGDESFQLLLHFDLNGRDN